MIPPIAPLTRKCKPVATTFECPPLQTIYCIARIIVAVIGNMASFKDNEETVTTKSILEAESRGALRALREEGLFSDEDSSMIFESFTVLHEYATHLRAAFNHSDAIHAVAVKTNPHN